ncbi:hypothetical protein [Labilibaculum manganireducens]|nr:hypothetical protein [Labilibaculum manganireducens]
MANPSNKIEHSIARKAYRVKQIGNSDARMMNSLVQIAISTSRK